MEYVNNAWSSKMLQDDLAMAQFNIDEEEFIQAINKGATVVIGHEDTAALFGVESNRQTLILHPGDIVYVCELNNETGGRLPIGITELSQIPDGFWFRFLKCIVFDIPNQLYFEEKTKNHYGDGTCYYNGVIPCNGCGECND